MRVQTLNNAYPEISNYFYNQKIRAYSTSDLQNIFYTNQQEWKLSTRTTYKKFVKFLTKKGKLFSVKKLVHIETGSEKFIYLMINGNTYDIACAIKKKGYLSYLTALVIHELTLQIPKTIYISEEIHKVSQKKNIIEQKGIDLAFSKEQRTTTNIYRDEAENIRFALIEKQSNNINIGIIKDNSFLYPVSNIERTLIDCVVRPQYSGGIFSVLEAFRIAINIVDTDKINLYLDQLNYSYPYHQLIGFYLDKAGCDRNRLLPFLNKVSSLNFYMTYNLTNKTLDPKWKIYYPFGI